LLVANAGHAIGVLLHQELADKLRINILYQVCLPVVSQSAGMNRG
jgi:hypothetical protein